MAPPVCALICGVTFARRLWTSRGARLALAALVLVWTAPGGGDPFRLVSIEPLPVMDGTECEWSPPGLIGTVAYAQSRPPSSRVLDPKPIRAIQDDAPTFSAVAVDPVRDEIVLQDENLFQIRVYKRTANTPPTASMTEPKRVIAGSRTELEFNCGLYVDPKNGDIYSVNNDSTDTLVIFAHDADGNAPPARKLHTPHGTYGIAVDDTNGEMLFSVEHDNAIVAYRKNAADEDQPLRLLQGDHTRLADPHGIAVDAARNWMFVANHGSTHLVRPELGRLSPPNWPLTRSYSVPGSGRSLPPAITVYERTARGDATPLRVIEGPATRLNWPAQISFDAQHDELFVANDGDHSVLVFRGTDSGNAAPIRVIKGAKTGLANPTGVWVDVTHQEVVVSNMGNHSATVYARTADGDVAPLRIVRAAPRGKKALAIGNPGAVAYDSTRDEILVPN
jgi:DNA-binding beta-propeller fold protein YncE